MSSSMDALPSFAEEPELDLDGDSDEFEETQWSRTMTAPASGWSPTPWGSSGSVQGTPWTHRRRGVGASMSMESLGSVDEDSISQEFDWHRSETAPASKWCPTDCAPRSSGVPLESFLHERRVVGAAPSMDSLPELSEEEMDWKRSVTEPTQGWSHS